MTVVTIVIVAAACDRPGEDLREDDRATSQQREARALRGVPLSSDKLPTTHHRIYVANLESRLDGMESLVDSGSDVPPESRMELAGLYRARFAYRGDLSDLSRATEQVDQALQLEPDRPELLVLAAEIALQRHHFERAATLLKRADDAGASTDVTAPIERELDWAAGRNDRAIKTIRKAAKERPTVHSLARLAVLERQLGNPRASETSFETAEEMIRDTNPYTVAWLHFVRGRGLLDDGETERAIVFLRESVSRLPEYTEGRLHLAEALLANDATSSEAVEIYRELAESGNAEAMGMLATLTEPPVADEWRRKAEETYAKLLEEHPAVSASHAADFYARHGDHDRAIELLTRNAELQPNGESFTRLAEAQFAAGRIDAARRSVRRALDAEYAPAMLRELRERISGSP